MKPRRLLTAATVAATATLAFAATAATVAAATNDRSCDLAFTVALPETWDGRDYFYGGPGETLDLVTVDVPAEFVGADGYLRVANGRSTHDTVLTATSATTLTMRGVEARPSATATSTRPVVLGETLNLSITLEDTGTDPAKRAERASLAGASVTVCTDPDPEPSETPSTPPPSPTPSASPSPEPSSTPTPTPTPDPTDPTTDPSPDPGPTPDATPPGTTTEEPSPEPPTTPTDSPSPSSPPSDAPSIDTAPFPDECYVDDVPQAGIPVDVDRDGIYDPAVDYCQVMPSGPVQTGGGGTAGGDA